MVATRFPSPIGELVITASDSGLTGVWFPGTGGVAAAPPDGERGPVSAVLARTCEQLAE